MKFRQFISVGIMALTMVMQFGVSYASNMSTNEEDPNLVLKPKFDSDHDLLPNAKLFLSMKDNVMTVDLEKTFPPSYIGALGNKLGFEYPYSVDRIMLMKILAVASQYPVELDATWVSYSDDWGVLEMLLDVSDVSSKTLANAFHEKYNDVTTINFASLNYGVNIDNSHSKAILDNLGKMGVSVSS